MHDCPNGEIRDLLPDLLHGRLAPAQRVVVESHVAGCALCAEELALLRDLRVTMGRSPAIDTATIVAAIPAHRAPLKRAWSRWQAAAAIVAVMVGGTSVALLSREVAPTPRVAIQQRGSAVDPAGRVAQSPTPLGAAGGVPATGDPSTSSRTTGDPIVQLAVAEGSLSELSESDLALLVEEVERFDALPSVEVEQEGGDVSTETTGSSR